MIEALFTITLAELFMGGGGRLLAIGPFTLRMLLFAASLLVFAGAFAFRLRRMDGQRLAFGLLLIYLIVHVFGLVVGALQGADVSDMAGEFQQSLYWLAAPFFALVLQSPAMVHRTSALVRISGVLLAAGYILILFLLAIGRLSILQVLPILTESGEVTVRGDNFLFYKGFLYLGVSIIFFVAIRSKYWLPLTAFVAAALVLTLTRGFLLSVSVSVLFLLVAQRRYIAASLASVVVAVGAFFMLVYVPSLSSTISNSQFESVTQRQQDFFQIIDNITPRSLLVGDGYGAIVNDRINIENTFLWAVWKLGIPGLLFWLTPLLLCAYFYFRIPDRATHREASAFFFGAVLVYIQTLTNPYLNNPIGLSFVLVAIFSLRTLAKEARSKNSERDSVSAPANLMPQRP